MKQKGQASPFPQKTELKNNISPSENEYLVEQQKHNLRMLQIINELKTKLLHQNNMKSNQNNGLILISQLNTQDLKDLHIYIHQNENFLFSRGQYTEARHLILIGEFIDDELGKRGEIKNSKLISPLPSKVVSPIPSHYNYSASAHPESSNYSPTRPKSSFLSRKSINKIQKFDDETTEIVKQMQLRHEQLRNEYISIWEKNMQAHYFQPSKMLQNLRKNVLILRKKCIQREEQLKTQGLISQNVEKANEQNNSCIINGNDKADSNDTNELKLEDFGDETLKQLICQFKEAYHDCEQLESEESENSQALYEKDYIESQKKIEEKQMMELEIFLKDRIFKRQKLLMKEGINVNLISQSPGNKSQCATQKGSPVHSRKNSPSKYRNISKMPPLISYSKRTSRNSTTPETPRNSNGNEIARITSTPSSLTKEAILQLTPNIMVSIPSSPALIAIEDKYKHNQEKFNKFIKKSDVLKKNNMSPTFRTEKRTQTPSMTNNEIDIIDNDDIEKENKPIPFDENNNNHGSKLSSYLPPI